MTHDYRNSLICPKYNATPVLKLLFDRELGRSRCRFKKNFVHYLENTYCDEEIVRSLYCDPNAYLEPVARRKVPRSQNPAFCRGRLFTNNYQSWYNLYTGPTSGPMLMRKNIFADVDTDAGRISSTPFGSDMDAMEVPLTQQTPDCKIIDAVCVIHPYNCTPPVNMKWRGPQLLLLSKSGWLYQTDVENGEILDKIYIPTKLYSDSLYDLEESPPGPQALIRKTQKKFNYHYLTVNRVYENVIIKSSRYVRGGRGPDTRTLTSTAYCILKLYPLSLYCHFVADVSCYSANPPFSAAVVNDFFIVTAMRQSKITFYSMHDVIEHYKLSAPVTLKKKVGVHYANEWPYYTEGVVGEQGMGVPYTMRNINLDRFPSHPPVNALFRTAAMKHSLQIGSSPYHYIIAMNKSGTLWALRHLLGNDNSQSTPVKIQISDKWDGSHWSGVRFHNDDTGRVIKQDRNTVQLLSIVHSGTNPFIHHECGAPVKCSIRCDFTIDVTPKMFPQSTESDPEQHNTTVVSSRGRTIRRPVRLNSAHNGGGSGGADFSGGVLSDEDDYAHMLVTVQYDYDLNLLAILYYRPKDNATVGWEHRDEGAELVVSIHDNYFGGMLASFVLEDDVSPSDRDFLSLAVDQDTMVYTRLRFNDHRCQYTVLRLNRRYGGDCHLRPLSSLP